MEFKYSYSVLRFLLLICCCLSEFTTAIDTITINQSVSDSETLISNGEIFKLGFFSPPNSGYRYVGIMYNLPVMTVVWVANRNKPLNDSMGTLEISGDGNLVILDGRKEILWSTNLSTSSANSSATAVLLDTGNLVLKHNSNDTYLWESFEHATDSQLQKMSLFTDLNTNTRNGLTSWRSPSDPTPGSFVLTIEPLPIAETIMLKDGSLFWRSGPWNGQRFAGVPNMDSSFRGGFGLVIGAPGTAYLSYTNINSSYVLYYVLNPSGTVEEKLWSNEKSDWTVTWTSTGDVCQIYGTCGSFGSCDSRKKSICTCFQGFVPTSDEEWKAGNWSNGCRRKTQLGCAGNSSVGKQDGFVKMSGVKLPDRYRWLPYLEGLCMRDCLSNCSCIAYAYADGIGCMMWDDNLIDVQKLSSRGDDLYLRLAYSDLGSKKDQKTIIITTVVLGSITIAVCAYFLPKLFLKYRGRKRKSGLMLSTTNETDAEQSEEIAIKHNVNRVKLEEFPIYGFQILSDATEKFNLINKLGQGGFGPVYKGKLPNGQEIAVKRLASSSNQGLEEFMNEVEVISRLQHRNLVKLHGCCVESEEKMLVYEYMSNGSLDTYLFDSRKRQFLDWPTRMTIIQGICRGLIYLHRDSRLRIIHRDLKASNILLDEELNPKISDFGMARIFGGKDNQANTTRVVGTYGYMSPEYALHGIFSEKSDVYSFGVVLLEIVSGRRNASFYAEDQSFLAYAWKLWSEEKIAELMDRVIYDPGMEADIRRYANVGLLCVQEIAANRPSMSTVLSMLNCEIIELPRPNRPAFLAIHRSAETESSQTNRSIWSANNVTVTVIEGR